MPVLTWLKMLEDVSQPAFPFCISFELDVLANAWGGHRKHNIAFVKLHLNVT